MSDLIIVNIQHYFDENENLYEKLMTFIDSRSVNQKAFTDLINIIKFLIQLVFDADKNALLRGRLY